MSLISFVFAILSYFVTLSFTQVQTRVDFRHFFLDPSDKKLKVKHGITLTIDEWERLKNGVQYMDVEFFWRHVQRDLLHNIIDHAINEVLDEYVSQVNAVEVKPSQHT